MTEGLLPQYRAMITEGALKNDPAQRLAVEKLQLLHTRLRDYEPAKPKKVGLGLFGWGREKVVQAPVPGLYVYGDVGRGKSMLMDLFYEHASIQPRRRIHFHAFMQEAHEAIRLARTEGAEDPIPPVAEAIADSATLLCFDEMQISDITDAMLVGRLFEQLFARGVVIVTTSNRHPDDLYKDGLNRHLFLPFINQIKDRLEVHHLDGEADHRQAQMRGLEVWHSPLDAGAKQAMDTAWTRLLTGDSAPLVLQRKGRDVVLPQHAGGVARATFSDLCAQPLGPGDYLAIAEAIRVLILDDIPILSPANNNEAKRFVTLIDALYEAHVRLICAAAAEPDALYPEGTGSFEFQRTASRLAEMRSEDWPPKDD
ncbi:cell division protein ZapE [Halovulum sp. GXIMD14793]